MALNFSYDFSDRVRSMNEVFATLIAKNPVTSRLLSVDLNRPFDNTKMEWLDDQSAPLSWTLSAAYTAGAGTMLTTDTTGLQVGSILQFDKDTGERSTLIAEVTAIVPNTSFDFTVYGGSVDENLAIDSVALLLDNPSAEGSDAGNGDGFEPIAGFNYSQIMDEVIELTYTAWNGKKYGINQTPGQIINYLVEKKLTQLAYKIGATTLNMPRVQRTNVQKGTMGGWFWFLKNTANTIAVDALGATIDSSLINQVYETIRSRGGVAPTIVAHPVQAKNLSALNTSGNNPRIEREDTTAGSYVERFVTDFGDMATIVYSYDMDKDKVAMIDPAKIALRPFINDGFRDLDATTPGSRTLKRRITGQFSLEVKNIKESHGYLFNLAI